jgi:hypothetical protein
VATRLVVSRMVFSSMVFVAYVKGAVLIGLEICIYVQAKLSFTLILRVVDPLHLWRVVHVTKLGSDNMKT